MKIALFGYGKMGKMIEKISLERGHTIVARIDIDTEKIDFSEMDVAIDFSVPTSAVGNIKSCIDAEVPIISGTTGWVTQYEEVAKYCRNNGGAFIYASNFSLGVNIFFELNKVLAGMMAQLKSYNARIEETHHIHKLDAPSGTAITLAEGIISTSSYTQWELENEGKDILPINSYREGEVPGTHIVSYDSVEDQISIKHTAHNREGFALGAVIAAEWLVGKKGVYSMKDVLNLK